MAKATVSLECAECGERFSRSKVFQNRKMANDWESYIERQEGHQCTNCWKKEQDRIRTAERAEALAKANAQAAELNLPALTGSEKQIAWATTLRQKIVDSLNAEKGIDEAQQKVWDSIKKEFLSRHTDSKYWIDNRSVYGTWKDIEAYRDEIYEIYGRYIDETPPDPEEAKGADILNTDIPEELKKAEIPEELTAKEIPPSVASNAGAVLGYYSAQKRYKKTYKMPTHVRKAIGGR